MSVLGNSKELKAYFNSANVDYLSVDRLKNLVQLKRNGSPAKNVRRCVAAGKFIGKRLRPWDIVAPYILLDQSKVWVGFEYETGYSTRAEYMQSLKWFDRAFKRGCYDCEGSGVYPVEYTFYPVELDKLEFKSGPAAMIRKAPKLNPYKHHHNSYIGTHVNISTPRSRSGENSLAGLSGYFCNAVISMSEEQRLILFGRSSVYGSGHPNWREKHWEFKLFNTTYDMRTWLGYCLVVRKYVEIIQVIEAGRAARSPSLWIKDQLLSLIPAIEAIHDKPPGYAMKSIPTKYRGA